MKKKLTEVSNSIKTNRLSFDEYETSLSNPVQESSHNNVTKEKKIKRTFYLLESIIDDFDAFYAKKLGQKIKLDKSDIISQAIVNLLKDPEAHIGKF